MRTSGWYWLLAAIVLLAGCHKKPRWDGARDLHRAAGNGDLGQVQALLAKGVPVDAKDTGDGTALHDAARNGYKEVAEVLVRCGARVDSEDNRGRTPVTEAMQNNRRAVVEYLVSAGAAVNLHLAAYLGDAVKTRNLLDSRTRINAKDGSGWTPLHYAAFYGYREIVVLLIAAGADPNIAADRNIHMGDYVSGTALYLAIRNGHEDIAVLLIDSGVEMDGEGKNDGTPLCWALEYGRLEVVRLLLAKKVNVNAPIVKNHLCQETPLGIAVENGHVDLAESLIAAGAHVNAKDKSGCTPLHVAVTSRRVQGVRDAIHKKYGEFNPTRDAEYLAFVREVQDLLITRMVELLVAHGAKVNEKDEAGVTPLHHAAAAGLKGVVEFLLAKGADVNVRTSQDHWPYDRGGYMRGATALHAAASGGDLDTVKVLLAHAAPLEARDESGETPLHYGVAWGNAGVVELLIASGADGNAGDNEGATPLLNALLRGHVKTAKALIAGGARRVDVNEHPVRTHRGGAYGQAPLLRQALDSRWRWMEPSWTNAIDPNKENARREWIELLLANGADPNERDDKGNTPLHSAVLLRNDELAGLFITHGTDVNAKNKSNLTALHYAAAEGRTGIVSELLAKGADVNARDNHGDTPLHAAGLRGHTKVVEVLVAHGADVNVKNSRGRTPLEEAGRLRHKDIVRLLSAKVEGTKAGAQQSVTKK